MTQQASQSGVAHVNGTELSYNVAGAGHPLTLAHGFLLDRNSWDEQFGVFARQYRVVRYDLRGWGDSAQEMAEPPFSPRQDLLCLLDYLNIQKTHLLGLSGSGTIALDFTLEHPEKVDALILVASGLSGYPQRMTESIQAFIGQYANALPEQYFNEVREDTRRMTANSFAHMLLENQRFRMPAGLDRVQVPALIVAGQHEVAMMRRSARDLAAALPAGQAYLVATSLRGAEEHSWNLQRPELFNAVTRAWLTDHPLPPGLLPLQ